MSNTINCSYELNSTALENSFQTLSDVSIYFWVMCFLGVIGLLNNCLVLRVFYKLKWFYEKQMILFINLAIIDLLACAAAIVLYSIYTYNVIRNKSGIESQLTCVETLCVFYGLCNASSTFALTIAIDRLMSKWWPYQWTRYETKFRLVAVILSWTWAAGHEMVFLITASKDQCIFVCLSSSDYPRNWWQTFVTVINNSMVGVIIIIYAIIPCVVAFRFKSCFKKIENSNLIILNCNSVKTQRDEFIKRLSLISSIYIACYLISIVPGYIMCDIMLQFFSLPYNITVLFSLICDFCIFFNSFLPLYIWLFDPSFRCECSSLISKFVFICK